MGGTGRYVAMAGDIKPTLKVKRNHVENGQAELIWIQSNLDEVQLRLRLAIEYSAAVHDVLSPALERVAEVTQSVEAVRREMSSIWVDGQARRWEDKQQQLNSQSSQIHCDWLGGDELHRKGVKRV